MSLRRPALLLRRLGLLAACLLVGRAAAAPACDRPLRMAVEQRPPYVFMTAEGQMQGSDIELLRAILHQAGCTLELQAELPRRRRYSMFLAGEIDILPAASMTAERREIAWFTGPYFVEAVALFALPDKAQKLRDIKSFEDIRSRRITVLSQGFGWFGDAFEAYKPALQNDGLISHYDHLSNAVQMLKVGRGELVLADRAAMRHYLLQHKMTLLELDYLPMQGSAHIMLSKRSVSESQFRAIDAALQKLEEGGQLKQIRSRYGLQ